jgi:orotate phosphoribosyltransferase
VPTRWRTRSPRRLTAPAPQSTRSRCKQPKPHGTAGRVEGCFATGNAVVIVEDVITTGQSALEAIRAVEAEGARVLGVLAVVDRQEGGRAALEHAGYSVEALVSAADLGLVAHAG